MSDGAPGALPDDLSFVPLGVGNAFSGRHYSTSFAVFAEGELLLVDAPHPLRKMMVEAGHTSGLPLDLERVDHVVLTHLHADHASGLEVLAFHAHFVLGRKIHLVVHPEVAEVLWERHLQSSMGSAVDLEAGRRWSFRLEDFFEVTLLDEARPVRVGPFELACRRTEHPIPTVALRIGAGRRSLGYSADTTWDPGLVDWLAESDLVIHETGEGIHTRYAHLAALPEELRARMRLVHYADDFDPAASELEALEQGRRYDVPPR